jgi:biopolymer transport protein ExbD
MARSHHYRRRVNEPTELDVTTFLNLMVVLVPFLLITAVFSRITVVELDMPTSSGAAAQVEPSFRVEVIVRETGLEISNGKSVIARMSKVEDEYDMPKLAEYMLALKQEYPDVNQASVLLEPTIPYDYLIQVMDIVRSAEIEQVPEGVQIDDGTIDSGSVAAADQQTIAQDLIAQIDETPKRLALFPEISVGEAP